MTGPQGRYNVNNNMPKRHINVSRKKRLDLMNKVRLCISR